MAFPMPWNKGPGHGLFVHCPFCTYPPRAPSTSEPLPSPMPLPMRHPLIFVILYPICCLLWPCSSKPGSLNTNQSLVFSKAWLCVHQNAATYDDVPTPALPSLPSSRLALWGEPGPSPGCSCAAPSGLPPHQVLPPAALHAGFGVCFLDFHASMLVERRFVWGFFWVTAFFFFFLTKPFSMPPQPPEDGLALYVVMVRQTPLPVGAAPEQRESPFA